jgi:hypothetical protein
MTLLVQFLTQIRDFVRAQDSDSLRSWLQVKPDSSAQYYELKNELRAQHPQKGLDAVIDQHLPLDDDVEDGQGAVWPGFLAFIKDYMTFWRDIDFQDLLAAHQLLSGLVGSCSTAFAHPTYGGMLLKTSMSLSETLAHLTMMLHRRPELTRRLKSKDDEDSKSVAESSAEIIQKIFTNCLTDRSTDRYVVRGKKEGIYMFANLVLKLLFAVRSGPASIL